MLKILKFFEGLDKRMIIQFVFAFQVRSHWTKRREHLGSEKGGHLSVNFENIYWSNLQNIFLYFFLRRTSRCNPSMALALMRFVMTISPLSLSFLVYVNPSFFLSFCLRAKDDLFYTYINTWPFSCLISSFITLFISIAPPSLSLLASFFIVINSISAWPVIHEVPFRRASG